MTCLIVFVAFCGTCFLVEEMQVARRWFWINQSVAQLSARVTSLITDW
jgi:hypothetical protein